MTNHLELGSQIMSKIEQRNADRNTTAVALSANKTHQHACITLDSSDRLRLIRFPPVIINVVRQAIEVSWPRNIKSEQQYTDAHEFKLHGNPWHDRKEEAVPTRIMM